MLITKFISFSKLLTLLLLISYSVEAKVVSTTGEFQQQQKENLNKTESDFHKNMLQPQVIHVTAMPDNLVKLVQSGFGILSSSDNSLLLLKPLVQTKIILQDMDRCESVSRFLFPYHFFW